MYLNTLYRPQELLQPQPDFLIVRTDVNLTMQNISQWTLSQAKVQECEVGKFTKWTQMAQIFYNAREFLPKTSLKYFKSSVMVKIIWCNQFFVINKNIMLNAVQKSYLPLKVYTVS